MVRQSWRRVSFCVIVFLSVVFIILFTVATQRGTVLERGQLRSPTGNVFSTNPTFNNEIAGKVERPSGNMEYGTSNGSPEAKVYKWKNGQWVRLQGFCNKAKNLATATLRTAAGAMKMYIYETRKDYWISGSIKQHGVWEGHIVNSVISHLKSRPELGVIDIGSQLGMYALVAGMMGRQVVAVEPLVDNVMRICKSVQDANMTGQFTILFTALSNVRETVYFKQPGDNMGGAHLKKLENKNVSSVNDYDPNYVPAVLLDDIVPLINFKKALIKIDVENHEYCAMQKGDNLFDKIDVQLMFMEWNFMKQSLDGQKLQEYLTSKSFAPADLTGNLFTDKNYRNWPYDIMWIKRSA